MWKKMITAISVLSGTAALITACGTTPAQGSGPTGSSGSSPTNNNKPVRGGTLNVAVQSDIPSLVPTIGVDTESIQYIDSVYAQLVTFSPTSMKIVPDLADSWSWNSNNTAITFHLRNAKFSNGDPVTAQDVKYSVEFVLNPKSTASLNIYRGLLGAANYAKHPATASLPGVKVIDSHTVEFILSQPEPYLLASLASGTASVLDEKVVKPLNFNASKISAAAVGAGPFMVKSWTAGKELVLVRNPHYWQTGLPYLNEVDTQIGVTPSNQFLLFKQGKLDVMGGALDGSMQIDSNSFLSAVSDPKLRNDYVKNTGLMTNYLSLNVQMKPFTDVRVRQALAYAVDRTQLVKVMNGRAVPAYELLPPGLIGYNPSLQPMPTNLKKAQQLLQAAGYGPSNPCPFTLITLNDPVSVNISSALQSQLDQVGFKVTIKPEAQAPYIQGLLTPKTDPANYGAWIDDYPDPQDFMFNILSGNNPGGFNTSFYNNPQINQAIDQGDTSSTDSVRAAAYDTAQQIALQQGVIVPLFYSVMDVLKQPTVQPADKMYYVHPVLPIQFQYLWK